jgi:polyisoprenoid-binding protein YceI
MTDRYTLDSERSRFTVQAFAAGMLSGFAHSPVFAVRRFVGEIRLNTEMPAESSMEITAQAESLDLTDKVKENDRQEIIRAMRQDVLETTRFPEITFRSTQIAITIIAPNWLRGQIQGDLRLHGVSKPREIDAQLRLADGEIRVSGEFTILQSAYKIKPVSAAAGMIKLKDELKLVFDLIGKKQE